MTPQQRAAMQQALDALTESVDYVRNEYEIRKAMYQNMPTRQARVASLKAGVEAHEAAIAALRQAIAEPARTLADPVADAEIEAAANEFSDPPSDREIRKALEGFAAGRADESYDQTALELCDVCGWKTMTPGDGCLNCKNDSAPHHEDLARWKLGYERYEKARKLNPRAFTALHKRNLAGERFDDMIDELGAAYSKTITGTPS